MLKPTIQFKEEYEIVDDVKHCKHVNFRIEVACCGIIFPLIECGCQGKDTIVCPNPKCDGITDEDLEYILGR